MVVIHPEIRTLSRGSGTYPSFRIRVRTTFRRQLQPQFFKLQSNINPMAYNRNKSATFAHAID